MILSSGDLGRPFIAPPGMAADRVRVLREALMKTLGDPELLADAKKRGWDVNPLRGEEMEAIARELVVQPPEVIERMKKIVEK